MKGKYLRKLGGFILAALLLPVVVTVLSNTNAQAQRRVVRQDVELGGRRQLRRRRGWIVGRSRDDE